MSTIWGWIKGIFWFLFAVAAAIVAFFLFRKSPTTTVDEKIKKIEAIENKTEADIQELNRLKKEKEDIEKGITDTATETKDKLDAIDKREDKPGDAGRSSDDMNSAWGN